MCGRVDAGVTIWPDPLYRSVIADWTDLGSTTYPFKNIYAGNVFLMGGGSLTNTLQNSFTLTLTNLNPLTFTGSNYIGQFSQLYSYNLVTPQLGGGGQAPPTNQFEMVCISYDGTNWAALTNASGSTPPFGAPAIFQNVYVAVVGAAGNAGALTLTGLNQTNLWNRTNSLVGQRLWVGAPLTGSDAATKAYVDANAGTASPWVGFTDTNPITHCSYTANGVTMADFESIAAWIRIDGLVTDSAKTNLLLTIAQTNLVAGWMIYAQTNLLAPLAQWPAFTNYVATTNAGEVTFKLPINFNLQGQYFLAYGTGTNWISLKSPTTATSVPGFIGDGSQLTGIPYTALTSQPPVTAVQFFHEPDQLNSQNLANWGNYSMPPGGVAIVPGFGGSQVGIFIADVQRFAGVVVFSNLVARFPVYVTNLTTVAINWQMGYRTNDVACNAVLSPASAYYVCSQTNGANWISVTNQMLPGVTSVQGYVIQAYNNGSNAFWINWPEAYLTNAMQ